MPVKLHGNFIRERKKNLKLFRKGSLRTVKSGNHRIVVGCLNIYHRSGKMCTGPTTVQSILHPRSEYKKFAKRLKA